MPESHLTVATVVINLGPAGTWESVCLGLAEGSLLPAPYTAPNQSLGDGDGPDHFDVS